MKRKVSKVSKPTKKKAKKKDGKELLKGIFQDILKRGTSKTRKPKKTGIKKAKKVEEPEEVYVAPKSYKIVGCCPKCNMFVSTKDFESKMIFSCVRCGTRKHKKYIIALESESKSKSESKSVKKYKKSKKKYLQEARTNNSHMEKTIGVNKFSDISIISSDLLE